MKLFKKIFSIFLRIAISLAILAFLFNKIDKRSLVEIIRQADKGLLALAFLVLFLTYIVCFLRWEMLLKAVNIRLPLARVIVAYCGGIFFSMFLPSTIGGDLVRSIDLSAHTKRPREVVATVLLDRLSGYVGMLIITISALFFGWELIQYRSVAIAVIMLVVLLVVILLVLFNDFIYSKVNRILDAPFAGRVGEAIKGLHQELHIFKQHKKIIFYNVLLSILVQAVSPLAFYVTALSLGIKAHIAYFFVFLPIIGAITTLPISIGGLGLRDAMIIFFFARAGVVKDLAFAMSLVYFFFISAYAGIGGLVYVFTVRYRRIQRHQPPQVQPS
jgi:hypothetical protein